MEFSIRSLHIEPPYDLATMTQAVIDTIKAEGHKSGYIRPFFYAGKSGLGLNPEKSKAQIDASVIVLPWGKYLEENVISVKISSIRRINPDANDPRAKVGGIYVNSIRANQEAVEAGFNEALLLDGAGNDFQGPFNASGNHITVAGSRDGCDAARRVLETLYEQAARGRDVTQGDVEGAIRAVLAQGL